MTVQQLSLANPTPRSVPPLQVDLDHAGQLWRAVSEITLGPFKSTLFYLCPCVAAFSSFYTEMRKNDPAQEATMPKAQKTLILKEIQDLTKAAGIRRTVLPYTSLSHSFFNAGGSFSLTSPALFIPHQHLFRVGKNPFPQESEKDGLPADLWRYSDDETRFLIARELGHIKGNDQLLRIAVKVALIAALLFLFHAAPIGLMWGFFFYPTPLRLCGGALAFTTSIAIHLLSERNFEAKMDLFGINTLARHLNDRPRATKAALSALEKMRQQNLARRQYSKLCRFYITPSGNNLLDFNHPLLTLRIARIKQNNLI